MLKWRRSRIAAACRSRAGCRLQTGKRVQLVMRPAGTSCAFGRLERAAHRLLPYSRPAPSPKLAMSVLPHGACAAAAVAVFVLPPRYAALTFPRFFRTRSRLLPPTCRCRVFFGRWLDAGWVSSRRRWASPPAPATASFLLTDLEVARTQPQLVCVPSRDDSVLGECVSVRQGAAAEPSLASGASKATRS